MLFFVVKPALVDRSQNLAELSVVLTITVDRPVCLAGQCQLNLALSMFVSYSTVSI